MKKEVRNGETWFVAETDQERTNLTEIATVLAAKGIDHSFIYNGEPGQENPTVEELSY